MNARALPLISLITLALGGCTSLPARPAQTQRDNPNVITRQTIDRLNARNAWEILEAVANRRPAEPVRGATTFAGPQTPMVMIDGMRTVIDALHTISAKDIEEIRILTANEATLRYGTGAAGGVIVITTRRMP